MNVLSIKWYDTLTKHLGDPHGWRSINISQSIIRQYILILRSIPTLNALECEEAASYI